MAKTLPIFATHFIFLFILLLILLLLSPFAKNQVVGKESHGYARRLDRELMGLKKEKLTHFKVYWHDIQSGQNPTSVTVVAPPKISQTSGFGTVNMIDNPITEGPEMSSKLVGKAQGFYALTSQEEIGLLMVMNFAFMEGKYNGSGITVLGRNIVFSKVREMPVIGGSGLFRFARGYVQAKTHMFDQKTGDAVVEYNVFVLHY